MIVTAVFHCAPKTFILVIHDCGRLAIKINHHTCSLGLKNCLETIARHRLGKNKVKVFVFLSSSILQCPFAFAQYSVVILNLIPLPSLHQPHLFSRCLAPAVPMHKYAVMKIILCLVSCHVVSTSCPQRSISNDPLCCKRVTFICYYGYVSLQYSSLD